MLSLLLISPFALLTFAPVAHATSPTLSLSVSSGYSDANTAGVKITGSGFPGLASGTGVQVYMISTSKTLSVTGATLLSIYGESLRISLSTANAVTPDANGNFYAYFDVPNIAGDTYNVFATYTPTGGSVTNTAPTTFQVLPYLDVRLANDLGTGVIVPTTRSAHYGQWLRVRAAGFGNAESVTLSGIPVAAGSSLSFSTDANGCFGYSGCASAQQTPGFVHLTGEKPGGSVTFTAVGQTSGLTATRSFTITPSVVVADSQSGITALSIPSTAPATVYLQLHGFANGETISAATVGGQAATFGSVTANTDGSYGVGAGGRLPLLYTQSLPFGSVSLTITGSKTGTVTFNAANGNVINPYGATGIATTNLAGAGILGAGSLSLTGTGGASLNAASQNTGTSLGGVPILSSNSQTSSTQTSIIQFQESTGFVGDTVTLYLTGWGASASFNPSTAASPPVTFAGTAQTQQCGNAASGGAAISGTTMDTNGATVCQILVPASLRGSHTIVFTMTGSSAANPGTTFTVKPLALFYTYDTADDAAGMASFTNSGASTGNVGFLQISGSGFGTASSTAPFVEALTLTVGSTVVNAQFVSCTAQGASACGSGATGSFTAIAPSTTSSPASTVNGVPDLAAGTYKLSISGATTGDNATGYDYNSWTSGSIATGLVLVPSFGLTCSSSTKCNLSQTPGTSVIAGQTIVVQSIATSGGSAASGIHGLASSAAYSVYLDGPTGTQLTTFTSTSGGQVPAGTQFQVPAGTSGVHVIDFVQNGASVVLGQTVNVQEDLVLDESTYGSLYVSISGSITVTPSAGNVGSSVAIAGTGLSASTSYAVQIAGITYSSFTTTSSGAIPSSVSFAFPAIALGTCGTLGTNPELGTSCTINLLNTATNVVDATGKFLLQSKLTLSPTTASPGSSVKATASGLAATSSYDIVWGASSNVNGVAQGTVVGTLTGGSDGSASANFTIPASAASGSYVVSLTSSSNPPGSSSSTLLLTQPPTETVSLGGQQLQGTSTFTPGTATQIVLNGQPTIQITYTNNVNTAVLGVVYAVVHNAQGQTVYYTTATIQPAGSSSATAYLILAGLPSGSYSVTIFAVTPSGVVISTTSSATATI